MADSAAVNEISGTVIGNPVMAGRVDHVHLYAGRPGASDEAGLRLRDALRRVTVTVGQTAGFLVAPGTVLAPARSRAPGTEVSVRGVGGSHVVATVHLEVAGWALLHLSAGDGFHGEIGASPASGDLLEAWAPTPDGAELLTLDRGAEGADGVRLRGHVPDSAIGAPVLDQRTGVICGLLDRGPHLVPVTQVVRRFPALLLPDVNPAWLSLLDDARLRAGAHRYPGDAVRRYLTSVLRAGHRHPYSHLVDNAPSLSTVYVSGRETTATTWEPSPNRDPRLHTVVRGMPAEDILRHHPGGAQVEGAPGTGKSSLVRHLAADQARRWLDGGAGEFVPVPVSAAAFARGHGLPDALAHGVANEISVGLDHAELVRLFRDEPIPGVPWLVLVDGMDEVFDPGRSRALRAIADHRLDSRYRFLVTSRPLGIDLAQALTSPVGSRCPTYTIEPFSTKNLVSLAVAWFEALGRPDPAAMADRLVRGLDDHRTHELGRIPLFATMLCILLDHDPQARLPRGQDELFGRFIDWATGKLAHPEHRHKITRGLGRGSGVDDVVARLCDQVLPLLREIAYQRQGLDDRVRSAPVLELAEQWQGITWPDAVAEPERRAILAEVLRSCGLVTERRGGFQFLHYTIEEYLAADHLAARYPAGPTWSSPASRRWLAPRSELPWPHLEVRMFLTARWARSGARVDPALRRMWRRNGPANVEFLVELVRRGMDLPDDVHRACVEHLLARIRLAEGNEDWRVTIRQLWMIDPAGAAAEIRTIARRTERGDSARWWAAVTEVHAQDPAGGVELMLTLAADQATLPTRRLQSADLLDKHTSCGPRLLRQLARDPAMGVHRVRAAELANAPEELVRLAYATWSGAQNARQALRAFLTRHENDPRIHLTVAERLRGVDPRWAVELAYAQVNPRYREPPIDLRLRALALLDRLDAERAGYARDLMIRDHTVPDEVRLDLALRVEPAARRTALLTRIGLRRGLAADLKTRVGHAVAEFDRAAGARVLGDVLDSCVLDDDRYLEVVLALRDSDPEQATHRVADLSVSPTRSAACRLRAAAYVAEALGQGEICALYAAIAEAADGPLALGAARELVARLPEPGRALAAWVARKERFSSAVRQDAERLASGGERRIDHIPPAG
ncbi:NACHT domain-containing protein [Actinokineospora globicatena]|uniref:NACHT domain-containing protein n=1 Tax=Actinokineospora globicatena TaxID=103729 RepID=UPI0020A3C366|nr:NACHT domain-containing protein [Actinokineospora globicatena]MCP2306115.1 NACHT domain-containing protein [Actinokineospora globicatena]GLW80010.1 hypothetical protein Aglo01_44910 [Actinokineospora globicatena]GLW86839.1 hypothetical protein Aglo02_44780 [Actinokineospora globicatena]